jgi:3'(2'), 5'-bisphosphate nucleotidase
MLNEMRDSELKLLLPIAIRAAEEASSEILDVYNSGDFQAEAKGDSSPLTLADRKAHHKIVDILESTGFPVLSEEGRDIPYQERKHWTYFWMVDPLDGTKEFIKRNGEFTVNIALVHNNMPVLGVVVIPVTGEVYYSALGCGAFVKRNDKVIELEKRKPVDLNKEGLRVVASRSHMNNETTAFISGLKNPSLVSAGSSLKFLLLVEGKADVYPRYAPTMEWDTAAAHAIINEVGLSVLIPDSKLELAYNKADLLNSYFVVR